MFFHRLIMALSVFLCTLVGMFAVPDVASAKSDRASKIERAQKLKKKRAAYQGTIRFFNHPDRKWMLHNRYRHLKCWDPRLPLKGPEVLCTKSRTAVRISAKRIKVLSAEIERLLTPEWCQGLTGNRAIGCRMAYEYWPSEREWNALDALWDDESEWDEYADNPTSDACGIPQAMNNCSYGFNPVVQIRWGLDYILNRWDYGRPSKARSLFLSRSPHWY